MLGCLIWRQTTKSRCRVSDTPSYMTTKHYNSERGLRRSAFADRFSCCQSPTTEHAPRRSTFADRSGQRSRTVHWCLADSSHRARVSYQLIQLITAMEVQHFVPRGAL